MDENQLYDIDSPEFKEMFWKAFEALHNNTKNIGEAARRVPKEQEEQAA
jgi:uncharacterized protein with HEPN domain